MIKYIGPEFIKNAEFEVDICGVNYPAQCRLNPPVLPKKVHFINRWTEIKMNGKQMDRWTVEQTDR